MKQITCTHIAVLFVTLYAVSAEAAPEGELWGSASASLVTDDFVDPKEPRNDRVQTYGPSLELGASFAFNEFVAIYLAADLSYQWGEEARHKSLISVGSLGFRYTFDVFQWVPYATVAIGAASIFDTHTDDPDKHSVEAAGTVGGGVNYRLSRELSLGAYINYRFYLTPLFRLPTQLMVGFKATWHFSF